MDTSNSQDEAVAPSLNGLIGIEQLPERFPVRFRSIESARWFLRLHKAPLVETGALLVDGRRYFFEPSALERYMLANMRQQAQRVAA